MTHPSLRRGLIALGASVALGVGLALPVAQPPAASAATTESFKIASYNLGGNSRWVNGVRCDFVKNITRANPDVILIQELTQTQGLKDVAPSTPLDQFTKLAGAADFAHCRLNGASYARVSFTKSAATQVFFKTSKFTATGWAHKESMRSLLSTAQKGTWDKYVVGGGNSYALTVLKSKATGKPYAFASIHTPCNGGCLVGTDGSSLRATAQAERRKLVAAAFTALTKRVTSDATYGKAPIVIGGDFNDFIDSSASKSVIRKAVADLGFRDTRPAADNVRIGPNKTAWPTLSNDYSILDYIFARGGAGQSAPTTSSFWVAKSDRSGVTPVKKLSDHYCVSGTATFKG